jgi:pimeloyl-ACP methyl ester carboxylesterase
MTGQRVEVAGVQWFYRTEGEGDPLVLLAGFPTTSYLWRKSITALARKRWVIAPDLPGWGDSDKPQDFSYKVSDLAAALNNFLNTLKVKSFSLVIHGYSLPLGLELLSQDPKRISSLALISPWCSPGEKLPSIWQFLQLPLVGEMMAQDPINVDRVIEAGLVYQLPLPDLAQYRAPYLASSMSGKALTRTIRNLTSATLAQAERNLDAISCPTLVIWGQKDRWIQKAEQVSKRLKDSTFLTYADARHFIHEDQPEQLTQDLLRFFVS